MPIKVLVISSYKDSWNAVRPEGEIFIGLQKAGLDITVMTQGDAPFAERFRDAGIRVIDFHPHRRINLSDIRFIRRALQEGKYDVMHLFNRGAIINGALAARGLPVKVAAYRGYTSNNMKWYLPQSYLLFLNPRIDVITCLADSVRDHLRRQLWRPEKAITVNKGHDLSWYASIEPLDLANEFRLPPDAFTFVCVANARKMKGVRYLIAATHYLPPGLNIRVLLIGRDMDSPRIMRMVQRSPYRAHFVFPGYRNDALNIVAAANAFVLPSIKGEATPKAGLEAMSLGIAPILTAIPGNKGMIEDGIRGWIVPPKAPPAIAKAMQHLYEHPEQAQQMGAQARQRIATIFSTQRTVQEMRKVYENLLAGTNG